MFFADRLSYRADVHVVTSTEYTAEDTANILINLRISLLGYPHSDNGRLHTYWGSENCHQLSPPKCQQRLNRTMSKTLATVVNDL